MVVGKSVFTESQKEAGKLVFSALAATIMLVIAIVGSVADEDTNSTNVPTGSYSTTNR